MGRKKVVALLAVAVVLVAAAVLTVYLANRPEEKPEEEKIVIFQTTQEQIRHVSVQNHNDSYSFIKSDEGKFVPEHAQNVTIASGKYDDLFVNLCNLYADQLVAENETNLAQYGFDEPLATVALEMENGERKTFLLGNITMLQTSYYFMEEGSGTVYTLSTYRAGIFMRKLADLRESPIPAVNPEYIEHFELSALGKPTIAASVDLTSDFPTWQMEQPYLRELNSSIAEELILNPIADINADEIIASQVSDFSLYGLDNPQAKLTYRAKDEDAVTLVFGKIVGDRVYFRLDGDNIVYAYTKSIMNIFNIDPVMLVNRLGYVVNLADVSRVAIETGGKSYDIAIDSDADVYSVNGQAVEASAFRELYRTLIGMTISEDGAQYQAGAPFYTMTVYKKDGTQDIVRLDEVDARKFKLNINGESQFIVLRTELDNVLEALAAY